MRALVDCNNFFVSCERVFDPELAGVPVCVLSSNDGCIISRSQSVKDLGVPMGAPYFKYKDMLKEHNVKVRSSNFSLYADVSSRIMTLLNQYCKECEQYSIDEAFLEISSSVKEYEAWAINLKKKVLKHIGIPVSIGVASTKTLAKIASKKAKENTLGVCVLVEPDSVGSLPVNEVWGIGRNMSRTLSVNGVKTIKDFTNAPSSWVKCHLGVVGQRVVSELKGVPAIYTKDSVLQKKSIQKSKSFGKTVRAKESIMSALCFHVDEAARQLRKQNCKATICTVSLWIKQQGSWRSLKRESCILDIPTDDTLVLTRKARKLLDGLYEKSVSYSKVGVCLGGFVPKNVVQDTLFQEEKKSVLMDTVDALNKKFGKVLVHSASLHSKKSWASKSNFRSPRYTTSWNEVMVVKAK